LPEPIIFRGVMLGVPICEDIWHPSVCKHLADFGAEIFICVNGSPYEIDKDSLRIDGVAKRRAVAAGVPMAYLNRVGGQDELVFDGASFVVNGDGSLAVQMTDWEEQEVLTNWTKTAKGWRCDQGEIAGQVAQEEGIYSAMVLALRDYVGRNRFPGVVLGLSGGIDRRCARRLRSMRWARTRCGASCCPAVTPARESGGCDRMRASAERALRHDPHRSRRSGIRRDAGPGLRRTRTRSGRGKCAEPYSRRHADGPVEQVRADGGDDGQQERDERGLRHALWRHERRV
jgi:hypothetical protein